MHSIRAYARHDGDNFRLTEAVRRLPRIIVGWHRRYRQRISLAELDNRMLADIGLSPSDRDTECGKPFWQP
jgi:uncharacterized protein YjiS (DUF1127 family)